MDGEISAETRRTVLERASGRCEYCHLPQAMALHKHEPDHIVPRQHGGGHGLENLALACIRCNRYKGPNVGSFDPETGKLTRFFNPRLDQWHEHFRLQDAVILPLTSEARVTVKILRINEPDRVIERRYLLEAGLWQVL
jgi:hypothetical protein